jgi:uncharacterized membrane protein
MNKYATVGGVLSIVSGAFGILYGLGIIVCAFIFSWLFSFTDNYTYNTGELTAEQFSNIISVIYGVMGGFVLIIGILALIGGIFAVRRKVWGLALAGAIASVMTFFPVGIVSIVFTSMAKPEFDNRMTSATVISPPPG